MLGISLNVFTCRRNGTLGRRRRNSKTPLHCTRTMSGLLTFSPTSQAIITRVTGIHFHHHHGIIFTTHQGLTFTTHQGFIFITHQGFIFTTHWGFIFITHWGFTFMTHRGFTSWLIIPLETRLSETTVGTLFPFLALQPCLSCTFTLNVYLKKRTVHKENRFWIRTAWTLIFHVTRYDQTRLNIKRWANRKLFKLCISSVNASDLLAW